MLKEKIKQLAKNLLLETINRRRYLHTNPELSFREYNTSNFICNELQNMSIEYKRMLETGVVGIIKGLGGESENVVALRADIDALPIKETGSLSYKSKIEGVMHACGHDAHTASLLSAAQILNELKSDFSGTVKLIFQPGEELLPGGANLMIKKGVLENPKPANIIGQHVMPFIDCGKVGFRGGKYMASADELYITVKGSGGHGAMPNETIDPVLVSSHIIVSLQQIVSRNADSRIPTVLSFGKIIGLGATNIIPDEVKIEGTFRTLDENWRYKAHIIMKKMAEGIAESMGASCSFDIKLGYPFLENDPETTAKARTAAEDYLGKENVVDLDIWMAAEDFAYYSHKTKGCFYRLGTRNKEKGIISSVHTSTFNIDENALETGSGLMAYIALKQLGS